MSAVQDHQGGITGLIAKGALKDFGSEARAAHSEHHHMTHAVGFGFLGEVAQRLNLLLHRLGQFEPA